MGPGRSIEQPEGMFVGAVVECAFGLAFVQGADGRLRITRPDQGVPDQAAPLPQPSSAPVLPVSTIGLMFDAAGVLVDACDQSAVEPSADLTAAVLMERAARFDLVASALRAIEELLALQLEAGVKHFQRSQKDGDPQAHRMLPILAAQKAARRQLHQARSLLHSEEADATLFAVALKTLCSNYNDEVDLCIQLLASIETFLLHAGRWLAAQALGQPLEASILAALISFSAAGGQASAARGLLQDALQYWE